MELLPTPPTMTPAAIDAAEWLQIGDAPTEGTLVSPVDVALTQARERVQDGAVDIVRGLQAQRVIGKRVADRAITQAEAAQVTTDDSLSPVASFTLPTASRQLNIEDIYTAYDFIQIPLDGTTMEVIEREVFEENHIAGAILDRVAGAVTEQGWDYPRFDDDPAKDEDDIDKAQLAVLEDWVENINSVSDFKHICKHTSVVYTSLKNAYLEVLGDRVGADRMPAGLDTFVASTMRVLRGHRGYVQWVAGQFRWFNVYMPNRADRETGVRLWTMYWQQRGIDVTSDAFARSELSRQLNSQMPPGVWNPFLTEVIHLKGEWLRSKYYGFPSDYRIGRLWALLKFSLDANISYMRNGQMSPFVAIWHGELSPEIRKDIKAYLSNTQGAANLGKIPLLTAKPQTGGGTGTAVPKSGLEIVPLSDNKEGFFLDLWSRCIDDLAMHYRMPKDLLTTENSNRASVIEALNTLDKFLVNDLHSLLEEALKRITKIDLGLDRRYIRFNTLDEEDKQMQQQVLTGYVDAGIFNVNEARAEMGRGPRPGGSIYKEIFGGGVNTEDEVAEEDAAAAGAVAEGESQQEKAQKAAAETQTGQQPAGADQPQDGKDS